MDRAHEPDVPPQEPPIVVARPDVAVTPGGVSVGMGGKLVLDQKSDLSLHLRSTLSGAVAFKSPGDPYQDVESGIRRGFFRWALANKRGYRTEIGLLADPLSRMLHGGIEAPLRQNLVLNAFGNTRWAHSPWGDVCLHFGNVSLRHRVSPTLTIQHGIYMVGVRARDDVRWIGTNLRIDWRGTELFLNDEGARGRRALSRKTWRFGSGRIKLGAQLAQHPKLPDRGLVELGLGLGRIGTSLYRGTQQRALLLMAGPFQIGFSERPRMRQHVFGFKGLSLSLIEHDNGTRDIGLGFVFGGFLRRAARTQAGWQWQEPLAKAAIDEPSLRWPGMASVLY